MPEKYLKPILQKNKNFLGRILYFIKYLRKKYDRMTFGRFIKEKAMNIIEDEVTTERFHSMKNHSYVLFIPSNKRIIKFLLKKN